MVAKAILALGYAVELLVGLADIVYVLGSDIANKYRFSSTIRQTKA